VSQLIIGFAGEMDAGKSTATALVKRWYPGTPSFRFSDSLREFHAWLMKDYAPALDAPMSPGALGFCTLDQWAVADFLGLRESEMARVLNVDVSHLRLGDKTPSDVLERFWIIANVCERVAGFFDGDVAKAKRWFKTLNPLLGNMAPREMILLGRFEKVSRFIDGALAENPPRNATTPELQRLSTKVRELFGENALERAIVARVARVAGTHPIIILEGIRRLVDIRSLMEDKTVRFRLMYLEADAHTRWERHIRRNEKPGDADLSFEEFMELGKAEAEEHRQQCQNGTLRNKLEYANRLLGRRVLVSPNAHSSPFRMASFFLGMCGRRVTMLASPASPQQ
jgi:dephospho-CoA kinase